MAIWIHVACRSAQPLTYAELEDVMGHMGWLDEPARFDPPLDDSNRDDPSWRAFAVHYRSGKRPITVHHQITREEMAPAMSDLRELLEDTDASAKRDLESRLDATTQLFVFEIPDDLPQDVWEMCDQAEAFLARERDGIIIADEGVFDGEMNQLVAFEDSRAATIRASAGLPPQVQTALADAAYTRGDPSVVAASLTALGCTKSRLFRAFYERYAGPFAGSGGYELLDVADGSESIATQTKAARSEHGLPARYLVISTYVGNAVLVYDCETDFVFDVDFEGSERQLLAGTLPPRWRSFEAFLVDFFAS